MAWVSSRRREMKTDPIRELHRKALAEKVGAYHDFISTYSKNTSLLYGFVEGKHDLSYYRGVVDRLIPNHWSIKLIPAGNKKKVYELYEKIDWRKHKKKRVCFFVDRDLSTIIPEKWPEAENIFVTPNYSIENHFADRYVCDRTLSEIYALCGVDHAEFNNVLDLFEQQQEEFFKLMVPVMARILCWRRDRLEASLDNIKLHHLFEFTEGKINLRTLPTSTPSIDHLIHQRCKLPISDANDISDSLATFSLKKNYQKFVRGKYVLWFVIEFCKSVHNSSARLFSSVQKKPKAHCELTCSNGVAILGPRVKPPNALVSFMRSNYVDYIKWHESRHP